MKVCSERNVYGYVFELIIPIVTFFLCIVCTFKFWSDFDIYEKIKVAIGDIYVCFFGWLSIHDFLYKKIEFNISCDEFSFTDKMKKTRRYTTKETSYYIFNGLSTYIELYLGDGRIERIYQHAKNYDAFVAFLEEKDAKKCIMPEINKKRELLKLAFLIGLAAIALLL